MTPTMARTPVLLDPAIGMRLSVHERRRSTTTSSLRIRTEEARRRLHNINVLVQVHRQRPLRRSRDRRAIRVLVSRVRSLQKLLGLLNWKHDVDEVLGGRVHAMHDAVLFEPGFHELLRLIGRLDDLSDLVDRHVLAMAMVFRVRNLEKVFFDLTFVLLLEADLEVDGLGFGGLAQAGPAAWDDVSFLDRVVGAGGLGQGLDSGDAANGQQEIRDKHAGLKWIERAARRSLDQSQENGGMGQCLYVSMIAKRERCHRSIS